MGKVFSLTRNWFWIRAFLSSTLVAHHRELFITDLCMCSGGDGMDSYLSIRSVRKKTQRTQSEFEHSTTISFTIPITATLQTYFGFSLIATVLLTSTYWLGSTMLNFVYSIGSGIFSLIRSETSNELDTYKKKRQRNVIQLLVFSWYLSGFKN